jgi:hypothetical protein
VPTGGRHPRFITMSADIPMPVNESAGWLE